MHHQRLARRVGHGHAGGEGEPVVGVDYVEVFARREGDAELGVTLGLDHQVPVAEALAGRQRGVVPVGGVGVVVRRLGVGVGGSRRFRGVCVVVDGVVRVGADEPDAAALGSLSGPPRWATEAPASW